MSRIVPSLTRYQGSRRHPLHSLQSLHSLHLPITSSATNVPKLHFGSTVGTSAFTSRFTVNQPAVFALSPSSSSSSSSSSTSSSSLSSTPSHRRALSTITASLSTNPSPIVPSISSPTSPPPSSSPSSSCTITPTPPAAFSPPSIPSSPSPSSSSSAPEPVVQSTRPMSLYRRPLPLDLVHFNSELGRKMFREAVNEGTMELYYPLAEQFLTQDEPAYCAISTLTMVLNSLAIAPSSNWKGPWRWYHENMLECCIKLDNIKKDGLTFRQFSSLARCHGLLVEDYRADMSSQEEFRALVQHLSTTPSTVAEGHASSSHCTAERQGLQSALVVSFSRQALRQTGDGHMSPIGGYHRGTDSVLVMDVARFKYPPYWVSVERMFDSMLASDRVSGKARGFCVLSPLPDICASPTSMRLRTVSVNPSAASSQQTPSFPVLASSTPNPTMSSSSTSTSTSTATSPFSHEFSVGSQPASGPASVLGDLEAEASRGIRVPCTAPSFDAPPAAAATSQLSAGASSLSPLSSSVPATASSPVPSPSSSSRTVVTGVDGKKRVLVCAQPTDHSHLSSMSEPMCDSNMNNGSSNQRSAFTIDNITTSTSLSSSPSSSPAAALTQLPTSVPSTGKSCPARIRSWFMTVNKYGRDRT